MKPSVLSHIASHLSHVDKVLEAIEKRKIRAAPSQDYVPPRTEVEDTVAMIWARLLGVDQVGLQDNFFRLGGHSILATQMLARVRQAYGVELPLRIIFDFPMLGSFAQQVKDSRRSGRELVLPPLVGSKDRPHAALSLAQQRLWFLDQFEPGNPIFNMAQLYWLRGVLQPRAVEESLNEVVRRHAILRTTIQIVDGQPCQVIAAGLTVRVANVELGDLAPEEREREAQRIAQEEATLPFDLSKGPLLRATLVRLAPELHALVLNTHHIVSDRWSLGVLSQELSACYRAFAAGQPPRLPELVVQYADFAEWQRQWLQGHVLAEQIEYWKQKLAGAPRLLELPTDHPRPAVESHRGASTSRLITKGLIDQLLAMCEREGVTLFMALLAGFQILLQRYSGQQDIVVGSPIANRDYAEIEPLIGCFVNTLALRTDLSGNPTYRQVLSRVRETCLGAYAHQSVPFERLIEELQPERSLSHNPIFQVLFALQNVPMQSIELHGLRLERQPVYPPISMFDMSWFAMEAPDGLLLRVEYNTDLFDGASVEGMLEHYRVLVESALAEPERGIEELPLMSQKEQCRFLHEFNPETAAQHGTLRIHDFFEQQATKSPDAIALVCGEERMSYGDLNRRANQIAHRLMKVGVGPEILVGVFLDRTRDIVAGLLGILKAGGAYVPLDPGYPQKRLLDILEDAGTAVVLTQTGLMSDLPGCAAHVICLDASDNGIDQDAVENPAVEVQPENLAYVLFTSGSTGRPKGVAIEHRSTAAFIEWSRTIFSPQELSGVLFSTSICFDLSVFEIFCTLAAGGKIIVAQNALQLPEVPARNEVSLVNTVPSAIAELVRMKGVPASVMAVALAGEALPDALVEEIYASSETENVYNLYGPTEDTTYSTYVRVPRGKRVTIGRPITGTQAYILDSMRNPVPVSVPGELYLAGAGLAREYYKHPELTAERFVPNPFRNDSNARMYRTGDLCRWLPDGEIQYLGRADYQVKLRGYRIELGEIEKTLASHPGVRQSVVMIREDAPGEKDLVAYIAPDAGYSFAEDSGSHGGLGSEQVSQWAVKGRLIPELRRLLSDRLPGYMMPAAFVLLETIPLTSNGKVNRKALPVPDRSNQRKRRDYVAPRSPAEELTASIWADVLQLEQIGVDDDFFELGGHSLLAAQVVSRIRRAFQVELPLRTLFEATTVAGLASRIEEMRGQHAPLLSRPILPVHRDGPLPLSFSQERLWFVDQLEPENLSYNISYLLRLEGELDVAALQSSLQEIVRRHEVLRTSFPMVGSQPVQVIAPHLVIPFHHIDLTAVRREDALSEAQRLATEDTQARFDLRGGPLLRASLLKVAAREYLLLFTAHHIVTDHWSFGVLMRELSAIYEAQLTGKSSPLPELPIQYADYSLWQQEYFAQREFQEQLAFWKDQLQGAPPLLELPTDRPRPAVQSSSGAAAFSLLPKQLSEDLVRLSRREGATLFMTLLAALKVLLARYSRQEDIVVGTFISNRNRAELESMIGFFVNTLVLRTDLSGDPDFLELLRRVREVSLSAYAHQDIPLQRLVQELRPERTLRHDPLVQVLFVMQNAPAAALHLRDVTVRPMTSETKTAKGDLFLAVTETSEGLRWRFEYKTDLFDAATIERMMSHLHFLLESIVRNPSQRISELAMLRSSETQQLVGDWNQTHADYPGESCLQERFEEQAALHPEAVAAVFEDQHLTYRELNRRASQLARYLQCQGVQANSLVGICLHRSLDMLVAMIAVLKAGAAYVPIDPAYPPERIKIILEDCGGPVLITNQHLAGSFASLPIKIVCLDRDRHAIQKLDAQALAPVLGGEHLAYVIHTSGSTGRPKGVMIPHRAVVNFMQAMGRQPGLTESDALLAVTTLSFDIAELELWLPLCVGARVIIASREDTTDGHRLMKLLHSSAATVMQATPATWRMLIDAGWRGDGRLKLLCGGEALTPKLAEELLSRCGELWNMYGPTETTIWSSVCRVGPGTRISLGRPIANTQFYVLDPQGNLSPAGVPGELYIGGDGVAAGYLNRPELTAERFVPDRFSPRPAATLYRTGDLVRYLKDGGVEYRGRLDNQVKLRGHRIELGEIESTLSRSPYVAECVVLMREDAPGESYLAAYFVPSAGQKVDALQLRADLRERLPEYMIPTRWMDLPQLPRLPNGKIDRKNLPIPDKKERHSATAHAPFTATQIRLAQIWEDVLNVSSIRVEDDFFNLGGHSLTATQVVSRVRQVFQVELPLGSLFEAPTISALAEVIECLQRSGTGLILPPILRVSRERPLPLSSAQQRVWFMDQLEPDKALYNFPRALRMKGILHVKALEIALKGLVERHEILRTTYRVENDQPVQIIVPEIPGGLQLIDFSGLSADPVAREQEATRVAQEEANKPFQLSTGPIFRALLLRLDPQDHILILNSHHIASDGWSGGVLVRDLTALYQAALDGRPSDLPELPIQYADYAVWQRSWLTDEILENQLAYWRTRLGEGLPVLLLPTDRPRPTLKSFRGEIHAASLPRVLVDAIHSLSRQEGATPFMTMLAAFQSLLMYYTKQSDIVLGTDVANRSNVQTEALIGFFVNLLVLRTDLSGDPTFKGLLHRVRSVTLGAYAHQDVVFDKLVEEFRPERNLSHNPLVQALFVQQNAPRSTSAMPGLELSQFRLAVPSKFDMAVFVSETETGMDCRWLFNPDLFEATTIARMANLYQIMVEKATSCADLRLSALTQYLDEAEQQSRITEHAQYEELSLQRLKRITRRAAVAI